VASFAEVYLPYNNNVFRNVARSEGYRTTNPASSSANLEGCSRWGPPPKRFTKQHWVL